MTFVKNLIKTKKEVSPNEEPEIFNTRLRNMTIVPEMAGSIIGVHKNKGFDQVEINDWPLLGWTRFDLQTR